MKTGSMASSTANVLVGFVLALFLGQAYAATEAGTEIRNQSVATYEDAAGRPQVSTSNEVITVVTAVAALEVTPDANNGDVAPFDYSGTPALAQSTAAGNTVYYNYYLTNLGNSLDTFQFTFEDDTDATPAATRIYQDVNGNGIVDPGDTLLNNDVAGYSTATSEIAPGATVGIIVAVVIPGTAATTDVFDVDINARSTTDNGVTDAVSNWNQTTITNDGVLTIVKSANVSEADPGQTGIIYTVSGSNTGNTAVYGVNYGATQIDYLGDDGTPEQATGVLVTDLLPEELDYTDATDVVLGNAAPASAVLLYLDLDDGVYKSDPTDVVDFLDGDNRGTVALFIPDDTPGDAVSDAALASGQGYSFTITVAIDDPLAPTTITNNASVEYGPSSGTSTTEESNNANIVVGGGGPNPADADLRLYPEGGLALDGGANNLDGQDENQTDDTYTDLAGDPIAAGTIELFTLTVQNDGTVVDTYDISVVSNELPGAQATVTLLKSDETTPLADSDSDGTPDVGPLNPGETRNFVVKVLVEPDADLPVLADNYDIQLRATSSVDPTDSNDSWIRISELTAVDVDIAIDGNTGDGNGGNDDPAANITSNPGTSVLVKADVFNGDQAGTANEAVDTYNLVAGGLPAGWQLFFYLDANDDGVIDPAENTPVANTTDLEGAGAPLAEQIEDLIVRIVIPAGTPAGVTNITVTATSNNNAGVSDFITIPIEVNAFPAIQIIPDNNATAVRGGTVTFNHSVVNIGNTTIAAADVDLSAVSIRGWSFIFILGDGTTLGTTADFSGGAGNYPYGALAPGASQPIYLKIFVPENAAVNLTDVITVTVNDPTDGVSDTAVDTVTVIDGNLRLEKSASVDTAAPGDTITYTTQYQNLGSAEVTEVIILDAIPANTTLDIDGDSDGDAPAGTQPDAAFDGGAAIPAGDIEVSDDGGGTWTDIGAYGGTEADVTNIRFSIGPIPAGQRGQVIFSVTVD